METFIILCKLLAFGIPLAYLFICFLSLAMYGAYMTFDMAAGMSEKGAFEYEQTLIPWEWLRKKEEKRICGGR